MSERPTHMSERPTHMSDGTPPLMPISTHMSAGDPHEKPNTHTGERFSKKAHMDTYSPTAGFHSKFLVFGPRTGLFPEILSTLEIGDNEGRSKVQEPLLQADKN